MKTIYDKVAQRVMSYFLDKVLAFPGRFDTAGIEKIEKDIARITKEVVDAAGYDARDQE